METVPQHVSEADLEQSLAEVLSSPSDQGTLLAIFVRPQPKQREALASAELSPEHGIQGDRWHYRHWKQLPDGRSDPESQVSLMNARMLRLLAGGDERAMSLAGDNLIVDLDLSRDNLPPGSRVRIGEVILEITAESHTGCTKFARRYGREARSFINHRSRANLNLRGCYARIICAGRIHIGDVVEKLADC